MARLSIDQIAAPNLSVASEATARASAGFGSAASSASDLLGQYQAGVEEKGDADIFQEIAALKNEDELNAYFSSNELAGRPMSSTMRSDIMNRRDNILGYEQDRATRSGTDATTGLTVARTGTANANTGQILNNTRIRTNQDDRAGTIHDRGIVADDRKIAVNQQRVDMAFQILQNQTQARATGSSVKSFEGHEVIPYNDPQTDSSGNQVGPDIYRSGYGSNTYTTEDGKVHKVTKDFGGTKQDHERDLTRRNEEADLFSGSRTPVTSTSGPTNATQTILEMASAEGNLLTADEWTQINDDQTSREAAGDAVISALDKEASIEATAQQLLDAASVNVDSNVAAQNALNAGKGATAVEEMARQEAIIAATADGGVLSAAVLGINTSGISPEDVSMATATMTDITEKQNRDPHQYAQNLSDEAKKDPLAFIRSHMGGEDISTNDVDINAAINELARKKTISRAEAAVSFVLAAEVDGWLPDWSITGDNLAQHRAGKKDGTADTFFKGNKSKVARQAIDDGKLVFTSIKSATTNLGKVDRLIQKLTAQEKPVPKELTEKRKAARKVLTDLNETHRRNPDRDQRNAGRQLEEDAAKASKLKTTSSTPSASETLSGTLNGVGSAIKSGAVSVGTTIKEGLTNTASSELAKANAEVGVQLAEAMGTVTQMQYNSMTRREKEAAGLPSTGLELMFAKQNGGLFVGETPPSSVSPFAKVGPGST